MAKYIAHAAISENGTAFGNAGDQTGKEVRLQEWYQHKSKWDYVLRIENEFVRKQFGNNMIDIAENNAVGYCQSGRNSLLTEAIKVKFDFTKIKTLCECDCSSAITVCLLGAIYVVLGKEAYDKAYKILFANSNCAITKNLRTCIISLKNNGILNSAVYNTSAYTAGTSKAVFGDIYLKEGSHVVAYIDKGAKETVNLDSTIVVIGKAVANQNMTIRDKYNTTGKALGYVKAGEKVEVLEIMSNGWYKIVYKKAACGYAYTSNSTGKYYTYTVTAKTSTSTTTATKKYVNNKVDYSLVFDPVYYANKYADLKSAFGTDENKLFKHFINYGMKEARQAISTFNVAKYKSNYIDLRKAFGNDLPAYYKHYCQYGYKENRKTI